MADANSRRGTSSTSWKARWRTSTSRRPCRPRHRHVHERQNNPKGKAKQSVVDILDVVRSSTPHHTYAPMGAHVRAGEQANSNLTATPWVTERLFSGLLRVRGRRGPIGRRSGWHTPANGVIPQPEWLRGRQTAHHVAMRPAPRWVARPPRLSTTYMPAVFPDRPTQATDTASCRRRRRHLTATEVCTRTTASAAAAAAAAAAAVAGCLRR